PRLIRGRMRRALMLGHAEPRARVALGLADAGFVERQAHEVADLGALAAVVEVFLAEESGVIPGAREVDLRERGRRAGKRSERGDERQPSTGGEWQYTCHRAASASGGAVRHGVGFHFEPSGSRLKCDDVTKSLLRLAGSLTTVSTVR